MTTTDQSTVRLTIEVEVDLTRAFEVFTSRFDQIKPREHNLLGEAIEETVLEPPHRLLLAWKVSPHRQVETDPHRASEVEVRFTALDAGRTRVYLEHRHLDRHGEG